MHYITNMHEYCLQNNKIPVNPESALGYYVSTTTHGNSKIPVMIDCLALALFCDEFYVFNSKKTDMPEGVIAEIVYWLQKNSQKSIKIIDFFNECYGADVFNEKTFLSQDLDNLKEISKVNKLEIENRLFNEFKNSNIKYGYTVASFYNYKHIDWIRAYCYSHKICPISPQSILQYSTYLNLYKNFKEYLYDRITLLRKSDELIFFTDTKNIEKEVVNLDLYSKLELLYWYHHKDVSSIRIIDWADIDVPKYKNEDWALTTAERLK